MFLPLALELNRSTDLVGVDLDGDEVITHLKNDHLVTSLSKSALISDQGSSISDTSHRMAPI
ncbi:hypothetical protein OAF09_01380 [bacterium]|nr:hypothetical protein [bacterium]